MRFSFWLFLCFPFVLFSQTGGNSDLLESAQVTIENRIVNVGDAFCTKIFFSNYKMDESVSFDIAWDEAMLNFDKIQSHRKNKEVHFSVIDEHSLHFNFIDDLLTKNKNGIIEQELCFQSTQAGTSEIHVLEESLRSTAKTPQKILISEAKVFAHQGRQNGITLTITTEEGLPGSEVCVDVIARDFTNITSMSFTLSWVATVIDFSQIDNINLNGFDNTSYGNPNPLNLTVEWEAPNQSTGETVPDGTSLFSICYDVVGSPGQSSTIFFVTIPVTILATDINSGGNDIGIMTNTGMVNIPNVAPLEFDDFIVSEENCFGPMNGGVDITVVGGLPPYNFAWSNMTSNEDLSGVAAGMYSVTVTDSNTPPFTIDRSFTVLEDLEPPIADAGTTMDLNCTQDQLTLDGAGSQGGPMIEYEWVPSNGGNIVSGADTREPVVDAMGTYTIRVVDGSNGCEATSSVDVGEDITPPTVNAGEDFSLPCDDGTINLAGENVDNLPNVSTTWTTMDGVIESGASTLTAAISAAGIYTLTIINQDNNCEASDDVVVTEATPPVALITEPLVLNCDRTEVTLDGNNSSGSDLSFSWSTTDGGFISGQNTATPVVNLAGTYTLTVLDGQTNCDATAMIEVMGNTERPNANAGADMTLNCEVRSLEITGTSTSSDVTFEWLDANGIVVSNTDLLAVNVGGTFTLVVTNEFGCSQTDDLLIEADQDPPIADAGEGAEVGCINSNINLDGTGSSQGPEFEYLWTTTNGTLVTGFNTLTPEVSSAGVYELLVTNTSNQCTALSTVEISLSGNLPPANAGENVSLCDTEAILMGNITTGVEGLWTSSSTAAIDNPTNNNAMVTGLQVGPNVFTWTLSTADCPDYSSDEVTFFVEGLPDAINDQETIFLDSSSAGFDVLLNDDLNASGGVSVNFFNVDSNFMDLGNGVFNYSFPSDSVNSITFDYVVCNDICPMLCDSATVTINREAVPVEPIDPTRLPNTITPNGDNINDAFIFDALLADPIRYANAEFIVFNRWGDVVFQEQPYRNDWRGTNQSGQDLPDGTYYYVLRLSVAQGDLFKGDVTILR